MTEGFVAHPDQMRRYASTIRQMVGAVGEGEDAANITMNENSVDVSHDGMHGAREYVLNKIGLHDSGRLDMAYGLICQPIGMLMEDFEQAVTDTIGNVMGMMSMLADGLEASAKQYTVDDMNNKGVFDGMGDYDAMAPAPSTDFSVPTPKDDVGTLRRMPEIPQPSADTSVPTPEDVVGQPLPRMPRIPEVRRNG